MISESQLKISIVTISFNQGRFLRECLESVIAQDYPNYEYIVIDAGSTDGSREIIKEYQEKIDAIVFEPDGGPADGLNKGFSLASGDIYYYLNADDILAEGSLTKIAQIFSLNVSCDIILGQGWQIDDRGDLIRRLFPSKNWTVYRYALGVANAIQQSTFFRASGFVAAGGFNVNNKTCWDGELLVDMALSGAQVCTTTEGLGYFRVYPDSITGSGRLSEAYSRDKQRIQESILVRLGPDVANVPIWWLRILEWAADPQRCLHAAKCRAMQVVRRRQRRS